MSIIETRAINPDYSSSKETPPLVGREKYPITRRMGVKAHLLERKAIASITPQVAIAIEQKLHNNSSIAWRSLIGDGRPKSAYFTLLDGQLIIEWGEIDVNNGQAKLHNYLNRTIDFITRRENGGVIRSGHIADIQIPDFQYPTPNTTQRVGLIDSINKERIITPNIAEYHIVTTLWQQGIIPVSSNGYPAIISQTDPHQHSFTNNE